MQYLFIALFAFSLLCGGPVQAGESRGNLSNIKKPIELNGGTSKRMFVTFNHSSHKGVKCRTCHHEGLPKDRYASCTNEECHSIKGARERDTMSLFMAYHSPDTDRSCYGCHRKLAGKYPNFKGCRPCHMSPQAREAAAAKK